jgi:hypothetical protein
MIFSSSTTKTRSLLGSDMLLPLESLYIGLET